MPAAHRATAVVSFTLKTHIQTTSVRFRVVVTLRTFNVWRAECTPDMKPKPSCPHHPYMMYQSHQISDIRHKIVVPLGLPYRIHQRFPLVKNALLNRTADKLLQISDVIVDPLVVSMHNSLHRNNHHCPVNAHVVLHSNAVNNKHLRK